MLVGLPAVMLLSVMAVAPPAARFTTAHGFDVAGSWTMLDTEASTTWEGASVEAAWARAFRDLQPDAQRLVRALAVLDGPSISLAGAAAVVELPRPRVVQVLAALATAGWGSATQDRFEVAVDAREHLAELARSVPAAEVDQVLTRVAAVTTQAHTTENGMSSAVRADTVNVVRAAGRHHRVAVAVAVARAAWRSPTAREHLDWCREVARYGEEAAIAGRQPELLVELLDSSAEAYASAGDWPGAERAWLRALAVVEDLGDTARSTRFLHLLASNYLNWERPHKAVDILLEVVAIHERAGDLVKAARAQVDAARTMADAGRADAAIEYLGRADRVLRAHSDADPEVTSLHATILSDLGQVHARLGGINTARNYYHRALALVVETDERTADRIRALQAALP
jgi:tetratricopeptide (TPR) repeat protein